MQREVPRQQPPVQVLAERVNDESGPSGRPGRVWRSLAALLLAGIGVALYHFAFQATKPSPLRDSGMADVLVAGAYAVCLGAAVALVLLPAAVLVDAWTGRRGSKVAWGTALATSLVLSLGVLAFVENFIYTSTGLGLKADNGVLGKVAFGGFSVALGLLAGRALARMRVQTARRALPGLVLVTVTAVGVIGVHLVSAPAEPVVQRTNDTTPLNVLIISADGIDADRMSVYGYPRQTTPFLSERSDEFALFENAFANNGNTTGSITSLLTGTSPMDNGVVYPPDALDADDARRSLPYLLGQLGYYRSNWAVPHYADARDQNLVGAFEQNNGEEDAGTLLAALPLGLGPSRWFVLETMTQTFALTADVLNVEEIDNPYSQVETIVGNTVTDDERLTAVEGEISVDRPFFINTHFMVTHGPALEPKEALFSRGQVQQQPWQKDFYDDALRQFDGYVERLYGELADSGKLDDTIVVVTSDHAIEYDATKRIPLLIRYPDGRGAGSFDVSVQRLDVAPTLLDALGVAPPAWMTGSSLIDPGSIDPKRQFVASTVSEGLFLNDYGFRSGRDDLILTWIRCGTWMTRDPAGRVEQGSVEGSTVTCDEEPVVQVGRSLTSP